MQVTIPTDLPTCQGVRDPGPSSMAPARLQLAADSIEPPCPMHSITCHFCSLLHRGCSCPGSGSHSVFPGWVGGADPRFWGCGRPPQALSWTWLPVPMAEKAQSQGHVQPLLPGHTWRSQYSSQAQLLPRVGSVFLPRSSRAHAQPMCVPLSLRGGWGWLFAGGQSESGCVGWVPTGVCEASGSDGRT